MKNTTDPQQALTWVRRKRGKWHVLHENRPTDPNPLAYTLCYQLPPIRRNAARPFGPFIWEEETRAPVPLAQCCRRCLVLGAIQQIGEGIFQEE